MLTTLRSASSYLYSSYISLNIPTAHVAPPRPPRPPRPSKMAAQTLFTLPILFASTSTPNGSIVCTVPAPGVYLLTFTSPPDNRLLTGFCQALILALDIIEFSHPPGVVITTSGIGKFYSNGLDLDHAVNTKGYWSNSLFALWKRFLTYPMPTVALVNGHAFAGGLMLAMYHDYRVFNQTRGFLCLNELEFGAPLPAPMSSIFRQKLPSPHVYRSLVLESKRFGAQDAYEGGLVDVLGGLTEALAFILEKKLVDKGKTGVYGVLKQQMYRETLGYLENQDLNERRDLEERAKEDARKETGRSKVAEWERNAGQSQSKL